MPARGGLVAWLSRVTGVSRQAVSSKLTEDWLHAEPSSPGVGRRTVPQLEERWA